VIAIIAILAAMLLPTLARSKATAQRIKCVGNLQQLSLAAHLYWDDNSGNYFLYGGWYTNGGQLFWFGWIESPTAGEGQRQLEITHGACFPSPLRRGGETQPS